MTANQIELTNPDRARKRVLLVDDNSQVLHDLRLFLEMPGEVEIVGEAPNGLEAIHLAHELRPDVIIMDLEMPVMDGFDATRQLRSQIPSLRIIILSVHADVEVQEKARLAGADGFVAKGASYETLLGAVFGKW